MPIEIPNNLYRIRELTITASPDGYYLSMIPGKAQACVLCVSREGNIGAQDLSLSEDNLSILFTGGKIETDRYILQGITGHQLAALSQYRGLHVKPPAYVRAWAMATGFNGTVLYVPDDPAEQVTLVPVHYKVLNQGNFMTVQLEKGEGEGYADGDLLYHCGEHLPIPIPKKWIGRPIPLRYPAEKYTVIADDAVAQNYIQTK